jgi:branched-chain amino acid transport system substrate-binding protein
MVGYRSCSFDAEGKLPPRSADFVRRIAGKITLSDSSLWWVACGYDAVHLAAKAVGDTGSTEAAKLIEYWNGLRGHPGILGNYTFTPTEHNGYPGEDVVMSLANSNREGAFTIAPGYG